MRILLTAIAIIFLSGCYGGSNGYNPSYHNNYNGWIKNDISTMDRHIRSRRR